MADPIASGTNCHFFPLFSGNTWDQNPLASSLRVIAASHDGEKTRGNFQKTMIDPAVLHQIWTEHVDRLLLIARSIGEPAEDAVQEAFVRLAVQPELPQDPVAWLVRVLRNQLLGWHREGTRRRRREQARAAEQSWLAESPMGMGDEWSSLEITHQLQQLHDADRQIIVMHLWGELTFQQIADILGRSRSTVHRQYQRALAELRSLCSPSANSPSSLAEKP
jgi:RNA polymerase sigma factor (sigma-70 family)